MGRRAMTGVDLRDRPLGLIARAKAAIRRAVIRALWALGIFTGTCIALILLVVWLAHQSQPTFPPPPIVATGPAVTAPSIEIPRQSFVPQPQLDIPPVEQNVVAQVNHEVEAPREPAKPVVASSMGGSSKAIKDDEPEPNSDTHVWIKSYRKLDGTYVQGHWRKKSDGEMRPKQAKETPHVADSRPADDPQSYSSGGGGGGTVYVKGYTKKNGTYVAPHTRSAPRKK